MLDVVTQLDPLSLYSATRPFNYCEKSTIVLQTISDNNIHGNLKSLKVLLLDNFFAFLNVS